MYGKCNTAVPGTARRGIQYQRSAFGASYRRPKYNVPVNIAENESNYEITVYAVGFSKENIKLSVVDDILYISGTRTIDDNNPPNFIKQEFPVKSFERSFLLNGQVVTANITAKQENSVLIVTLPKTPEAQKPEQDIKVS
jgi:HSP20 family protein